MSNAYQAEVKIVENKVKRDIEKYKLFGLILHLLTDTFQKSSILVWPFLSPNTRVFVIDPLL